MPATETETETAAVTQLMDFLRKEGTAPTGTAVPTEIPTKTVKELSEDIRPVIRAFEDAKALLKFADEQKDALEERIRQALDGADIGMIRGIEVVRVNASHNSHMDRPTLREAYPEAYEAALRRTDYTYLTTHSRAGVVAVS